MRLFDRRRFLTGLGLAAAGSVAGPARGETPVPDLEALLRQARPGDVIELPPGDYRHKRLDITKPLTLRAANKSRWAVRIHTDLLQVQAPDVRLEHLTILGAASYAAGDPYLPALDLLRAVVADRLTLVDCNIRGSRGSGVRILNSSEVRVESCLIADNVHIGVALNRVHGAFIRDNVLSKNVWFGVEGQAMTGCRVEGNRISGSGWTAFWCHSDSTGNIFSDNTVEDADAGITIASSDNRVAQNRFRNNTVAIVLGQGPFHRSVRETGGKADDDTSTGGSRVRENLITDGSQVGILVREGTRHKIVRNTIYDMQRTGIVVQSASRGIRVEDNTIARCGLWGVLVGQSAGNVVRGNRVSDCRAAVRLVESPDTRVARLDCDRVGAAVVADDQSGRASKVSGVETAPEAAVRLRDGDEHRWMGYRALFGDFHVHSEMSDGAGSLEAMYHYASDAVGLDFMSASDHSDYAILLNGPSWWAEQAARVEPLNRPGVFSAFRGQEVTYAPSLFGHWNVYYAEDHGREYPMTTHEETSELQKLRQKMAIRELNKAVKPRPNVEADTPQHLIDTVEKQGGDCFVIVHHYYYAPGFWEKSPKSGDHLLATEVCSRHGIWASSQGPSRVRLAPEQITTVEDGLASGWKLAVIGGSDSHYGTAGTRALAGVYASENSRKAIREALRARRTFATTGARIALELSADGRPMGAEYTAEGRPELSAAAVGWGSHEGRLLLLRGNEVIDEVAGRGRLTLTTTDNDFSGPTYYRVHYLREDGEQAWSSPIWVS